MATQLCWTVVTWTNIIIWGPTDQEHGKNPEKRVQWWQNLQVSLIHSCRAIESHSSSMMLDVKMAPLCVTKKIWERHSEAYYQHPQLLPSRSFSLSLPLFAFLSVPPCHRKCHSVRQRRGPVTQHKHTHHLNENSSLPPPQLFVLNPHTHKHITIDCHVRPRYPLQTSWLLDPAWQFKCIKKKVGEIANYHPVLPSPAKSKKL